MASIDVMITIGSTSTAIVRPAEITVLPDVIGSSHSTKMISPSTP